MALELKKLKKNFGRKLIFQNLSYNFNDSGIYTLVGESGIGKTTLLRIIAGLDSDFSGEVNRPKRLSFAFQEHRLFPHLNVVDNILISFSDRKNKADRNKAIEMLRFLGFNDADMLLYPDQLSGGMKQRVSLARAFLYDAEVMLLDEPTKELDEANAKKVISIIKRLSENRLVILVSHNAVDHIELSSKIINLEDYK